MRSSFHLGRLALVRDISESLANNFCLETSATKLLVQIANLTFKINPFIGEKG